MPASRRPAAAIVKRKLPKTLARSAKDEHEMADEAAVRLQAKRNTGR